MRNRIFSWSQSISQLDISRKGKEQFNNGETQQKSSHSIIKFDITTNKTYYCKIAPINISELSKYMI